MLKVAGCLYKPVCNFKHPHLLNAVNNCRSEGGILLYIKQLRIGTFILTSNVFMAPLAGYTCYPFRMLCYELGAGLCFTEMVSANALKYKDKATQRLLFTTSKEPIRAVQLLGGDPVILERMACDPILENFDLLDINMGCPAPNIVKSGEGSALLADPKRASAIIRGVKRSGKPVSVKLRVGLNAASLKAAEFAKYCEDAGADFITIHGRTRAMMYDGKPYYDQIEQAKACVRIPVIANGGIFSVEDAEQMFKYTGADGVMIARYGLQNPFIFSELTNRPIQKSIYQILSEQLSLVLNNYDESFSLTYMKRIISYAMKKRKGTKQYKTALYQCGNPEELSELLYTVFYEERGDTL